MRLRVFIPLFLLGAGALRADPTPLSVQRLEELDQRGYFPPAFKEAVYKLVESHQALKQARRDEKQLGVRLPVLQKQCDEATARAAELRKELALYTHPEDADFEALRAAMKNPAASPEQRLTLAQAFVWSYPSDPRQTEAVGYLQQIQKRLGDERQAVKDAAAARTAARAALVQRAESKNLSLKEWQDFLRDMSQEELLGYLGHPQTETSDYWIYSGAWTWDPKTKNRAGLRINFNGTRVLSVVLAPQ